MKKDFTLEALESKQAASVQCRYCRDSICAGAVICKTCGEPQILWRRATRFFSTALSSIVAIGSLAIAMLQYYDAKAAQKEATVAKAGEAAQMKASQDAVDQIISKLNSQERLKVKTALSGELETDLKKLEGRVKTAPADSAARRDLLLHRFLAPNANP